MRYSTLLSGLLLATTFACAALPVQAQASVVAAEP